MDSEPSLNPQEEEEQIEVDEEQNETQEEKLEEREENKEDDEPQDEENELMEEKPEENLELETKEDDKPLMEEKEDTQQEKETHPLIEEEKMEEYPQDEISEVNDIVDIEENIKIQRKVLLVSSGSRGDVQPFLALAEGLVKAQWQVALCTFQVFEEFIHENTNALSKFYGLEGDPMGLINSEKFKTAFFKGNKYEQAKIIKQETDSWFEKNLRIQWKAAQDFKPSAIICGITHVSDCLAICQRMQIPMYIATTIPYHPTKELAPPAAFSKPFSLGLFNRFLYWSSEKVLWAYQAGKINRFRREIGLAAQKEFYYENVTEFCMFSEVVVPRPTDWPEYVHITGYWVKNLKDDYQPDPQLKQFVEAGEPPVYIGFGSMPIYDVEELAKVIVNVIDKLNLRAIFCYSQGVETLEFGNHEHVYLVKSSPHEWLLPRCSIAIHHGGSGTLGASLRAGIPSIVYPLLMDQPFWAMTAANLGVGPKNPCSLKELNAEILESHIVEVNTDQHRQRAQEISEKLKNEDGVSKTIILFEEMYNKQRNCGIECVWQKDEDAPQCNDCHQPFTFTNRRHHCRSCGLIFCVNCLALRELPNFPAEQMVCRKCWNARTAISSEQSL